MSNRLRGKVVLVTAVGQGTTCARFRWHFSTGNPRQACARRWPPRTCCGGAVWHFSQSPSMSDWLPEIRCWPPNGPPSQSICAPRPAAHSLLCPSSITVQRTNHLQRAILKASAVRATCRSRRIKPPAEAIMSDVETEAASPSPLAANCTGSGPK
jgi:hypothetical protein